MDHPGITKQGNVYTTPWGFEFEAIGGRRWLYRYTETDRLDPSHDPIGVLEDADFRRVIDLLDHDPNLIKPPKPLLELEARLSTSAYRKPGRFGGWQLKTDRLSIIIDRFGFTDPIEVWFLDEESPRTDLSFERLFEELDRRARSKRVLKET